MNPIDPKQLEYLARLNAEKDLRKMTVIELNVLLARCEMQAERIKRIVAEKLGK